MIGNCGYNGEGRQRRRCAACNVSGLNSIDNTVKRLEEFSSWFLSGARQVDMPSQGR